MLYILAEEQSFKNFVSPILSREFPELNFQIIPHQGKQDLITSLPNVLPSLSKVHDARIIISIDQDGESCLNLKNSLQETAGKFCYCPCIIRIVCRKLEAWYLGDMEKIEQVYPRFNAAKYQNRGKYRDPQSIEDPEREILALVPEMKGHSTLPKVSLAKNLGQHFESATNCNRSYYHFFQAVGRLAASRDLGE